METLSDQELLTLNQQGLIPGPDESESAFCQRVAQAKSLSLETDPSLGKPCLLQELYPSSASGKNQAFITQQLFDIFPSWVPVFFSNYQLFPWQGGCAWFYQLSEEGPMEACFQLRKQFANSARYLGIYSRDELIAHESVHIGRMLFEEPKFEEILAYRTATSAFRRWFSPIVQSSKESLLFVLVLLLTMLLEFFFLLYEISDTMHLILGLKSLLVMGVALGVARLWKRQRQFKKCLEVVEKAVHEKQKALAVVYRLTDQEIINFSHFSSAQIKEYIESQRTQSLRWRVISLAYCKNLRLNLNAEDAEDAEITKSFNSHKNEIKF